MKRGLKYVLFMIFFMGIFAPHTRAQDPNWTLNPSDFEYSMTFTAFLSVDHQTLIAPTDKVAAFINGEVRGVSNVQFVPSANKYLTYLTVYANTNNETINFEIYDSVTDVVISVDQTHLFNIDGNVGGVFQSYSIAQPALNNQADILTFEFKDVTTLEETISSNAIAIMLAENTEVNALVPVFSLSANSKVFVNGVEQVSGTTAQDFTNPILYTVLSEDESEINVYEVSVTFKDSSNTDPTVTITSPSSLNFNATPIILEVAFSKVVSDFEITDFNLNNAIISSFSTADQTLYQVELIPTKQGVFSLEMPSNAVLDVYGNPNEASNILEVNYDVNRPIITEINIEEDTSSWWFHVVFNEPVTNVDVSDFELLGMGASDLMITSLSALSETTYRVNVSNGASQEGLVSLNLKTDTDIRDMAGNTVVVSTFQSFFISDTLANLELQLQSQFILYPNPVEHVLQIKSHSNAIINAEIYTLDHKKVMRIMTNNNSIDVHALQKGIYFIVLEQENYRQVFKFIKF